MVIYAQREHPRLPSFVVVVCVGGEEGGSLLERLIAIEMWLGGWVSALPCIVLFDAQMTVNTHMQDASHLST